MNTLDEERRYRALLELPLGRDLDGLLAALSDESWRVRKAAVERLAEVGAAQVVPQLIHALGDDGSAARRNAALEALVRLGEGAVGPLREAAASPDAELRKFALDALGAIGSRAGEATARQALTDADPNVRLSAIEALGKLGTAEAVRCLSALLTDASLTTRVAALDALGRCGAPVPFAGLEGALRDRTSRRAAVRALARCPDRRAGDAAAEALLDRARGVREAAFAAWATRAREGRDATLGGLTAEQREKLLPLALEALGSEELPVAEGAADVTGALGGPEAAVGLAGAAGREELRPALRRALVRLGPGVALEVQRAFPLLSVDGRVVVFEALREEAVRAAGVGGGAVEALALRWIGGSAEEPVRLAAIELLGAAGGHASLEPLADRLDGDPAAEASVEAALSALAARHADRLRELCRSRLEQAKEPPVALLRLLGRVGTAEDLGRLRRDFWREQPSRPRLACALLQALRAQGPLDEPVLRVAAGSADLELALEGLRAAWAQGSWEVVRTHARHSRWEVRCVVAAALRAEGSPAARDALAAMLEAETNALAAEEERAAIAALSGG